jgi:hypothetical protein
MFPHRLILEPGRSRGLGLALTLAHAIGGVLACLALQGWGWWALISTLAAGSLLHSLRHAALRTAGSAVIRLELAAAGVRLTTRRGEVVEGQVLGSSFVSRRLVLIGVRSRARRLPIRVALPSDSLPRESFRRLCVWLRWRREPDPTN